MRTWLLLSALLLLCTACATGGLPQTPSTTNAAGAFVVWTPAAVVEQQGLDGAPLDGIEVHGGETLRLDLARDGVTIGERVRAGAGSAEIWSNTASRDPIVYVRPTAFATAILLPRGAIRRAHVGHPSDPGYYWFDLEARVLAWAEGPLKAPFPLVAPAARLDVDGFAELDRALEEAVGGADAADRDRAYEQARAIRRVAGLRAVRALRPPAGYPYFFDDAPSTNLRATKDAEGHAWYAVAREPLELVVDGPAVLHVWARATRTDLEQALVLRVMEGGRERAASGTTVPRLTAVAETSPAPAAPPLRRALVHVPPGRHAYRIDVRGGSALVYPLVAKPVVHVEDALSHVKSEADQLETAREACASTHAPGLCALALALLGEDREPPSSVWSDAIGRSSPRLRAVAQGLAAGGPRDPTVELELRAVRGEAVALSKLSDLVSSSSDAVLRAAWVQGVMRGTRWSVAHHDAEGERWTSIAHDERGSCDTLAESPWPEVTTVEHSYATTRFHGAPTVDLLVSSSCAEPDPIELAVDGEHLVANPSAGFVHWRVRVREEGARVSLIRGAGRVYAMPSGLSECAARWEAIHAPRLASTAPRLVFDAAERSPGLEFWLREGTAARDVTVLPVEPASEAREGIRIAVSPTTRTLMALDAHGDRWWRVSRVGLPAWARRGVIVRGGDGISVRGIVRVPHPHEGAAIAPPEAKQVATALDEGELVTLTRRILATSPTERGPLYLDRALLLAAGGAARGALDDAEIAKALGARGPHDEDAVVMVRSAIAARPMTVEPLPAGRTAYGIDEDFDVDAPRCVRSEAGARARLARVAAEVAPAGKKETAEAHAFSAALAARVVDAVQQAPLDPRGPGLVARALAESRWKLRSDPLPGAKRVAFPERAPHRGPVDGDGELRPSIAAASPFDEGSFATVVPGRPAHAMLATVGDATARIDIACVPRGASAALAESCPLELELGAGPPLHPAVDASGRASVPVKLDAAPKRLVISLASNDRWVALLRIVFDKQVPRTIKASDGWILAPPHVEHRYVVEPGHPMTAAFAQAAVVRIDAVAAYGPADVVFDVRGSERVLPTDGRPAVIALPEGGLVAIRTTGHAVSIAVAERVPSEPHPTSVSLRADAAHESSSGTPVSPGSVILDPSAAEPWRAEAGRSPRPLTPLESALGTVFAAAGGVYGTIRGGVPSLPSAQADGYVFALAEYRRRVESIGLWTSIGGYTNARNGEPTYGASLVLYEEIEKLHLRLSATVHLATQRIDRHGVRAFKPRGFAEYSWRATRDFFVLPRVGFDGTYASLVNRPSDLSAVDDNVFNPYRAKRPTFLFAQALLWFAPYFDDIFYLRNRMSYDPLAGNVSHVSVRPGFFFAAGQLDLSSYLDATWYAPTDSITNRPRVDELLGGTVAYNFWSNLGSLDVQPGVAGLTRLHDGGFQVNVFVNLLASYRRGRRDFSSLELDFPEQLGGGIPWRGATLGGYQ